MHVGRTAVGTAMVRAAESRRPDRLFDDPFAHLFADSTLFDGGTDSGVGAAFAAQCVLRTRFFDDYLLGAGCPQVVLLGAGLDTRAFRLPWPPGVALYELDLPEVLADKAGALAGARARCHRREVAADLREAWELPGFRAGEPTAWLAEGLLTYLSADEVSGLLERVDALSAPASRFACDHGGDLLDRVRNMPSLAEYAGLWRGGLPDLPEWLRDRGWEVTVHVGEEVARRYGRSGSVRLITAVKR